ncbi:MAG: hypothetical protein ACREVQ_00750 [Burkholderiales bacterium]
MRLKSGWSSESPGRVVQLIAIATLVLMMSVILHKGIVDIARLARLYSGDAFWRALGRYVIANLSG